MRTAIAFIACLAVVCVMDVSPARSQTQPAPFSWERKTDKVLKIKRTDRLRRAYRILGHDPDNLGMARNQPFATSPGTGQEAPAPGAAAPGRFDSDGNGSVSRKEYLGRRTGMRRVGTHGATHRRARHRDSQSRRNSRFRAADRNGDGRLSPAEQRNLGGRRR
jgi:hypothetical protein